MSSEVVSIMSPVVIKVRVMGKDRTVDAIAIEDALECAVDLISNGHGIPKGIFRNGIEICSEQDINTYWEQSTRKKA